MKRMWSKNEVKNLSKEVIESGQVDNAKPIYWHSCTFKRIEEGTLYFYLDFIIINNSDTLFTRDSFMAWLNTIPNAEIKVVQGYDFSSPSALVSFFKLNADNPTTNIDLHCINLSTGAEEIHDYGVSIGELTDNGVNKIN